MVSLTKSGTLILRQLPVHYYISLFLCLLSEVYKCILLDKHCNFRVELSEGQKYIFSLRTRRRHGSVGIDRITFPKTERTNMVRIVTIGIDGVMMGALSEIKLLGCHMPPRWQGTTEVCALKRCCDVIL